jgi:2-oxoisovalerate dehydrogenase E2 component (dihydrolipoyl transacylase)
MAFTLTLPEVGETVTEGTVERWLKQPGDQVKKYEPIVEVDTDKVLVELPSPVNGTLKEILAPEGSTVAIGAGLAIIDEVPGEVPAEIALPKADEGGGESPPPVPESGEKTGRGPTRRATPRVRRLAEELNVDLDSITASGPGDRIREEDVRAAAEGGASKTTRSTPAAADDETVALTGIRRTIARRMSESAFSAPAAWLAVEADVTALVELRQAKREAFREQNGVDLTYLPFMAHAVSRAFNDHPYLNASWAGDEIILRKAINLGIAVATERGLVVPVIHGADGLSVTELAKAMTDLGERARANKLKLDDVQGGTFTLDNTGAFGSLLSQPIINQGQSAIVTLEAVTRQPRVTAGDVIEVRSVVAICLSFDHRVLDGHQAGEFLRDLKSRLEAIGADYELG